MNSDPLLRPLEDLLNRNIAGSSRARGLLARVAGQSLEVRFKATPVRIRMTAGDGRVSLARADNQPADARIEGTPLSLARLAFSDPASSVRRGGIDLNGDAEVAQAFQELLLAAQPDLEEELSRITGDAAAHHLARLARGALAFGRRSADTMAQNVQEYLTEEGRDVATRPEVDEYLAGVDSVREATDRLEARIARLEARGKRL